MPQGQISTMANKTPRRCIIVGNTVTGICTATMAADKTCEDPTMVTTANVASYTSISEALSIWTTILLVYKSDL
ncbi:hypothetical protein KIN20_006111 [Parelaphostrongylus tenuis]|uniref:Uncharacterized protein n=1 Tax=Parelaphostrongylus tenuis TaxID=148309 RepID=A0AAD5M1C3_PARTN|nr:hypothetical protein KIN20_006111 [Parelaphostrongylus tenuis]